MKEENICIFLTKMQFMRFRHIYYFPIISVQSKRNQFTKVFNITKEDTFNSFHISNVFISYEALIIKKYSK